MGKAEKRRAQKSYSTWRRRVWAPASADEIVRMSESRDLLTQEEERAYLTVLKSADPGHPEGSSEYFADKVARAVAYRELVTRNVGLAAKMSARYGGDHYTPDLNGLHDRLSDGVVGLMVAVQKFDMEAVRTDGKPIRFSTYAGWRIRGVVADERRRRARQRSYTSISGWDEDSIDVRSALRVRDARTDAADHAAVAEESAETIRDMIVRFQASSPDNARMADILILRNGIQGIPVVTPFVASATAPGGPAADQPPGFDVPLDGLSLHVIGALFGVTKERIRQLEVKAVAAIRGMFEGAR